MCHFLNWYCLLNDPFFCHIYIFCHWNEGQVGLLWLPWKSWESWSLCNDEYLSSRLMTETTHCGKYFCDIFSKNYISNVFRWDLDGDSLLWTSQFSTLFCELELISKSHGLKRGNSKCVFSLWIFVWWSSAFIWFIQTWTWQCTEWVSWLMCTDIYVDTAKTVAFFKHCFSLIFQPTLIDNCM